MGNEVLPSNQNLATACDSRALFKVIYADPPWQFKTWTSEDRLLAADKEPAWSRRPPYPCMTTAEICALPVERIAAPDCALFLWAIYPKLPDAFEVIRAWGFTYRTVAFTWVKLNPSGRGFAFGFGYWTRSNPELCLLATRGHPKRVS